jgi:hypothetical protein|tara:strand:+ start:425 stop:640 length:216 start_codon:yes stop_codon:yes gene_type:complete
MTKYLLILQVCSFLTGECKLPVEMEQKYNSWYECTSAGSLNSLTLLQEEGAESINKYRLFVQFGCFEVYEM